MTENKYKLYFYTISNLKLAQIFFRIFYYFRNRLFGRGNTESGYRGIEISTLNLLTNFIIRPDTFSKQNATFKFLNKSKIFGSIKSIKFDSQELGELWCYNINYFDFLIQHEKNFEIEKEIIDDWICKSYKSDSIVWDPYPVSIRLVNLIKWFSINKSSLCKTDQSKIVFCIKNHEKYLRRNIEYHLGGNHLLENYISLSIASIFFNSEIRIVRDFKRVRNEVKKQFLDDGFHFERSIMYHNILVEGLLNVVEISKNLTQVSVKVELLNLKKDIDSMLFITRNFLAADNYAPSFNDVIRRDHRQRVSDLLKYAQEVGFRMSPWSRNLNLSASGYIRTQIGNFTFIYDYGPIGPRHIPGHGHCDCFSFELFHKDNPIVVNKGTSTYDYGKLRFVERSTSAHNTVSHGENEQDEIWSRFRVARQHQVKEFTLSKFSEDNLKLSGKLFNYNGFYSHQRGVSITQDFVVIDDKVESKFKNVATKVNLYFHPEIEIELLSDRCLLVNSSLIFEFVGSVDISLVNYQYAESYNCLIKSVKIEALVEDSCCLTIREK